MLAISKSIEVTRSIPATWEILESSSGDFHAAYVKGARLLSHIKKRRVDEGTQSRLVLTRDPSP